MVVRLPLTTTVEGMPDRDTVMAWVMVSVETLVVPVGDPEIVPVGVAEGVPERVAVRVVVDVPLGATTTAAAVVDPTRSSVLL